MQSLEIYELIERFEAGGATQSFTHTGVSNIMSCLSGIEANTDREYTFICKDEQGSLSLHSVDSLKGFELHVGDYIFSL